MLLGLLKTGVCYIEVVLYIANKTMNTTSLIMASCIYAASTILCIFGLHFSIIFMQRNMATYLTIGF